MAEEAASPSRPPHSVEVSAQGGVLRARFLARNVGEREATAIAAPVIKSMEKTRGRLRCLVLDLSDVQFLNSRGLGMCIDLRNRAHALSAPTVLIGLTGELFQLLDAVKVERLFEIVADEGELAARLRGSTRPAAE
ncbi:MAG: STAS domain-containing protein [Phycisphaerales bacterium]|nr:MAG: STAS domain-containing protein [Phycisphaerales bacterium]